MRRVLTALVVAALASAAAALATPHLPHARSAVAACGHERWEVKTLQDAAARSVDFTPTPTSVDHLRALRPPTLAANAPRRAGVETSTYRVSARLIGFKFEADSDVHLVIADRSNPGHTMIVEFPDPGCTARASAPARDRMRRARSRVIAACGRPTRAFRRLSGSATVAGVGFWDFKHHQTGVAPNAIELHPATSFSSPNCH